MLAAPAMADCSSEVQLAVKKQGQQKFLRKETQMISEQGPVKMTVEYQLPDRMRQVISLIADPRQTETVVVGRKAWSNAGDGWREVGAQETDQLVQYMKESSAQMDQEVGKFECLGGETVDGKQLRAYRGIEEEAKELSKNGLPPPKSQNEAARIIYLDPETGLPAQSIFARPAMLDKPIFKEVYTYPADLKIEQPGEVKK
jgi:hypothetical protein